MRIPKHFFYQWKVSSLEEIDEYSNFIFLSKEECEEDLRKYLVNLIETEYLYDFNGDKVFDWDSEILKSCPSISEEVIGVELKNYTLRQLKFICSNFVGYYSSVSSLKVKDAN